MQLLHPECWWADAQRDPDPGLWAHPQSVCGGTQLRIIHGQQTQHEVQV